MDSDINSVQARQFSVLVVCGTCGDIDDCLPPDTNSSQNHVEWDHGDDGWVLEVSSRLRGLRVRDKWI